MTQTKLLAWRRPEYRRDGDQSIGVPQTEVLAWRRLGSDETYICILTNLAAHEQRLIPKRGAGGDEKYTNQQTGHNIKTTTSLKTIAFDRCKTHMQSNTKPCTRNAILFTWRALYITHLVSGFYCYSVILPVFWHRSARGKLFWLKMNLEEGDVKIVLYFIEQYIW